MTEPFQRYLRLLGIARRPSGLDGLRTLVRRHLSAVPFENISKLLLVDREHAGRVTTLTEFLDGIEYSDLGGTCYTNNPFLTELLRELGYDADLLGADMSRPNVHTCIRVRIDSVAYHVDVGFAAPFREPLRLDRLPVPVEEGTNRYVLARDAAGGGFCMSMFSDAESGVAYVVHDPPRPREFFDPVVLESYALSSTFMRCLRISRVFDECSLDLIDRKLYRHEAGKTAITHLESMQELKRAVEDRLGMPRCPVERAIAILERLTVRPFFGDRRRLSRSTKESGMTEPPGS
jgi:arylamine N-acetyltransferase